ncbi:MAG: hypothetical protein MUF45_06120 [Spirosomaceae bacterium]|jgi:hypothetical protein|nr:hypothetical protein [Spirosomataceae bacterium]
MKTFVTLFVFLGLAFQIKCQTLTISESTVFFQKKESNVNCNSSNPNPKFYINGIYVLAGTKFNGRNQYLLQIPNTLTTSICVINFFPYTLPIGTNYLRIRWSGTNWQIGFFNSNNAFQSVAIFSGDTPTPECEKYSTNNNAKIGGADCYCQTSMILTGTAPSTPRYSQTTINSTQIVGNSTNILYQAGNSVSLNAGFQVNSGGVFEAKIATCN